MFRVLRRDGQAARSPSDNWVIIIVGLYGPITGKVTSSGFVEAGVQNAEKCRDAAMAMADGSMFAGGYLSQEDQGKFNAIAEDQSKFFSEYENVYQYEGPKGEAAYSDGIGSCG